MDLTSLWDRLILAMRKRIGHRDVEIWLKSADPLRLDGNILVLEVNNRYYAEWIVDNYLDALQTEASAVLGVPVNLEFTYREEPTTEVPDPAKSTDSGASFPRSWGINESQTFENFVIGGCNDFAHAASYAVAEKPATAYNPLFIYGATGLGKTHLMQAIANQVVSPLARLDVCCVSGCGAACGATRMTPTSAAKGTRSRQAWLPAGASRAAPQAA